MRAHRFFDGAPAPFSPEEGAGLEASDGPQARPSSFRGGYLVRLRATGRVLESSFFRGVKRAIFLVFTLFFSEFFSRFPSHEIEILRGGAAAELMVIDFLEWIDVWPLGFFVDHEWKAFCPPTVERCGKFLHNVRMFGCNVVFLGVILRHVEELPIGFTRTC